MAYLATNLISRAFTTANIVSADIGNAPSSHQLSDGFFLLNELLASTNTKGGLLPYSDLIEFPTVAGQEEYEIENLVMPQTLSFNLQSVRYSLKGVGRNEYFGSGRVNNLQSLPYMYHFERNLTGNMLYIYFIPNQVYIMNLVGLFGFTQLSNNMVDLSTVYSDYYISYLRLKLADEICKYYNVAMSQANMVELERREKNIRILNVPDLNFGNSQTFTKNYSLSYAQANLGQGWRP